MSEHIVIEMGRNVIEAELNDTPAAKKFASLLPLELLLSRWGDEYYGSCGTAFEEDETLREEMDAGELAIWPPASAFCMFFGPTPVSSDDHPRSASGSLPIGRFTGNFTMFKMLGHTVKAKIRKVE